MRSELGDDGSLLDLGVKNMGRSVKTFSGQNHGETRVQTQFQLDDAVIEAKLKVLHKLKDFVHINHTLTSSVNEISKDYDIDFQELWTWAIEQMFSNDNLVAVNEIVTPPKEVTKAKRVFKPKIKVAPVVRAEPKVLRRQKPTDVVTIFQNASNDHKIKTVRATTDQSIIEAGIVDSNRHVRLEAIRNPETPEQLVQRRVEEDSNVKVQRVAIRFVKDQVFLSKIAVSDSDIEVRQKAIRLLKDKKLLQEVVVGNYHPTLIKAACLTISELP